MKKIVEDVIAAENDKKENNAKKSKKDVKKVIEKSIPVEKQKNIKIAGVNNKELEEVLAGLTTTIKVIGCGGAGTNTIARCFSESITGADLISINTDAQHLLLSESPHKILIGRHLTRGLGAGSLPQIGEEAARESDHDIRESIVPADMIFVTCGLGGGTGTGSAPIVAHRPAE